MTSCLELRGSPCRRGSGKVHKTAMYTRARGACTNMQKDKTDTEIYGNFSSVCVQLSFLEEVTKEITSNLVLLPLVVTEVLMVFC